jgi:uncharacterized protein
MKLRLSFLCIASLAAGQSTIGAAAQTPHSQTPDSQTASGQAVQQAVEQWRSERLARLTGPTGWLTLVGLYWLNEGDNSFGSGAGNTLVLERAGVPAKLGVFRLQGGAVTFTAAPGSQVKQAEQAVGTLQLKSDAAGDATVLSAGTLQFFVIDRAGKLGVRVRDTAHPARTQFKGLKYYPINADWALPAKFEPYQPARRIPIVNILGLTEQMVSPGAIVFNKNGREYRLDTVLEAPDDKELFIMFADTTNSRETYGAGRFIYIPLPVNGSTLLDFNRAYNPPCAFNDFATCPLPPKQNRLALRVDAGELRYGTH